MSPFLGLSHQEHSHTPSLSRTLIFTPFLYSSSLSLSLEPTQKHKEEEEEGDQGEMATKKTMEKKI